ncbi:MAG: helix-turn-helix domain-containing protein [Actinomycetota bacterium]|nr:helix-turn-helix domain-containing protein [Actinomycetota bacterium]
MYGSGFAVEPLLTVKELSRFLGVAQGTIYGWVADDRIPHIRLGGAIRFDAHIIEAWIATSRGGPEVLEVAP